MYQYKRKDRFDLHSKMEFDFEFKSIRNKDKDFRMMSTYTSKNFRNLSMPNDTRIRYNFKHNISMSIRRSIVNTFLCKSKPIQRKYFEQYTYQRALDHTNKEATNYGFI